MPRNCAELSLYQACCDTHGHIDRYIDWGKSRIKNEELWKAFSIVLDSFVEGSYCDLVISRNSLVKNDEEAAKLLKFAQQGIPGAEGLIVIHSYKPVKFSQKIKFKGWKKEQKSDLVELLKKSGYQPSKPWEEVLEFYP